MKSLTEKINSWSPLTTLFLVLGFFLPFQYRYKKLLRGISKEFFKVEEFPLLFDSFFWFYVTDILMIGVLALGLYSLKQQGFSMRRNSKYLGLFLLTSLISVIFSQSGHHFWPYYRWLQLALPIGCFFVFAAHLEAKSLFKNFCWLLLFLGLAEFGVAQAQYILQNSIGLKKIGELHLHVGNTAVIPSPSHTRWLFDSLFRGRDYYGILMRPAGTFPHPNILGGFMGLSIFASFYLFLSSKTALQKRLIVSALVLEVFTLFLTFSRGALFGLIGGFFILFIFLFSKPASRKMGVQLLMVFILLLSIPGAILFKQIKSRGGVVSTSGLNKQSDSMRMVYQTTALKMAKKKPLLGLGWNQYDLAMRDFDNKSVFMQKVHNIYLLIYTEMGALGLLAFIGFIFSTLFWTWKGGLNLMSMTLLTMFVFMLWFGGVDHYWITNQHGRMMFFMIAALLVASSKASLKQLPALKG